MKHSSLIGSIFVVLCALQAINGLFSWCEESKASDAIETSCVSGLQQSAFHNSVFRYIEIRCTKLFSRSSDSVLDRVVNVLVVRVMCCRQCGWWVSHVSHRCRSSRQLAFRLVCTIVICHISISALIAVADSEREQFKTTSAYSCLHRTPRCTYSVSQGGLNAL